MTLKLFGETPELQETLTEAWGEIISFFPGLSHLADADGLQIFLCTPRTFERVRFELYLEDDVKGVYNAMALCGYPGIALESEYFLAHEVGHWLNSAFERLHAGPLYRRRVFSDLIRQALDCYTRCEVIEKTENEPGEVFARLFETGIAYLAMDADPECYPASTLPNHVDHSYCGDGDDPTYHPNYVHGFEWVDGYHAAWLRSTRRAINDTLKGADRLRSESTSLLWRINYGDKTFEDVFVNKT